MADLAATCDLKPGDRVVAVEHSDSQHGAYKPGGRCHPATVTRLSGAYVIVSYDDKSLGGPAVPGRDQYWAQTLWRAWDGMLKWKLVKVTGIKALTVWQPWAFALAMGWKPVENRGRRLPLKPGQVLAIHAGKTYDHGVTLPLDDKQRAQMERIKVAVRLHGDEPPVVPALQQQSRILCLVRFTGAHDASECVSCTDSCDEARWCTPWSQPGQFHNEVSLVAALEHPVACGGQRGIWTLPEEAEAAVRAQLGGGQQ